MIGGVQVLLFHDNSRSNQMHILGSRHIYLLQMHLLHIISSVVETDSTGPGISDFFNSSCCRKYWERIVVSVEFKGRK